MEKNINICADKISVIIPTWNRATTLSKSIKSALKQTFPPLEILVCDDGSTDNSRKIVSSINDQRVKWVAGEHSGRPAVPRNRGIKASRGNWLGFLDSDDEWLPEKLEKQLKYVKKIKCDVVCSNAIKYVPSKEYLELYHKRTYEKKISFSILIQNNYVICSSILIKKDIVNKCNGFSEDRALLGVEDYALWLRAATFTNFAYLNEPLLIYKDEPEISIRAYSLSTWEQRINILNSFISWTHNNKYNINNKQYSNLAKKLLRQAWVKKIKVCFKKILLKLKIL